LQSWFRGNVSWLSRFSQRTVWAVGSIIVGAAVGLASASYSLSQAGLGAPRTPNGWQEWNLAPESPLLPYALGHFLAAGQLPPSRSSRQFVRRTDDEGRKLNSSCPVLVSGPMPVVRWWTLAATANNGKAQDSGSYLDAGSAIRESTGKLIVTVAPLPQPGNWIAPATRGNFMLVLTLHDVAGEVTELDSLSISMGVC
jgi:hypothetical protein